MRVDNQKLVLLANLFAKRTAPLGLCRSLAQPGVLFERPAFGVHLVVVNDSGALVVTGSYGKDLELEAKDLNVYGEGFIAEALRDRKPVTTVRSGLSHSAIPFYADYPLGALVVTHESEQLSWEGVSAQLFAAIGAMYLQKFIAGQREVAAIDLTPRQREVLSLIAQGVTNQEIAAKTKTSVSNIAQTCSSLYRKLGVPDRQRAVQQAKELGLLEVK